MCIRDRGHLSLLIPAAIVQRPVKAFRESMHYSFLDRMISSPKDTVYQILHLTFPILYLRCFHLIINITLLGLFFSWFQDLTYWFYFFSILFLSLPGFLGLGLLAASIVVFFGRGERFVFMFSNLAQIAAGVYFPAKVFSSSIEKALLWISPFNQTLAMHRQLTQEIYPTVVSILFSLSQGLFLCIAGCLALKLSFRQYQKRTSPLILHIS